MRKRSECERERTEKDPDGYKERKSERERGRVQKKLRNDLLGTWFTLKRHTLGRKTIFRATMTSDDRKNYIARN